MSRELDRIKNASEVLKDIPTEYNVPFKSPEEVVSYLVEDARPTFDESDICVRYAQRIEIVKNNVNLWDYEELRHELEAVRDGLKDEKLITKLGSEIREKLLMLCSDLERNIFPPTN